MAVYSIIKKSELKGDLRMDAEYYQPEYLDIEKKLKSISTKTIAEISQSVVNFGAYSLCNFIEWQDEGIPYLNVQNIRDGYIDFDNVKFISEETDKILKKSKVEEGQVLLTMAGTIGNAAVAHKIPEKANSNQAIAKIILKNDFSPYYLSTFLNSYYGNKQTERVIVSSVQPNIFLGQIKEFRVPLATKKEQQEVEKVYKDGLDELENSKSFYSQAEEMLLKELGLENFTEQNDLFSIVKFSDIKRFRRMDAEYFQPKYEKLISRIKQGKCALLGDLIAMKKGIEIGAEQYQESGKLFLRVSSLSKQGIGDKDQKYLSDGLYQKLKANFEPRIGEILLTKDATPGIAYVLKEKIEGIISSGILRLKLKQEIEAEYLALFINSILGQIQTERDAGGSIISHWKPEQVKNLIVPILPQATQQKIAELVKKSHQARQKAKELLQEAKNKVENLIEIKS